jgi:hypothetical protein
MTENDVFGPLSVQDQIASILDMFEFDGKQVLRPIIGKTVRLYGYNAALYAFGQLRAETHWPTNIWAFVTAKAQQKAAITKDDIAKNKWDSNTSKESILQAVESLFISGAISAEIFDSIDSMDDAKRILEKYRKR